VDKQLAKQFLNSSSTNAKQQQLSLSIPVRVKLISTTEHY
jgi:hypothetical protein